MTGRSVPEVIRVVQTSEVFDLEQEYAQIALRGMLAEDTLRDISWVKSVVAGISVIRSASDYILERKVKTFLAAFGSAPQWQRREMISRLEADPAYNRRVGQHVIELLSRVDGHRKPTLIGHAFAARASEDIDLAPLHRLFTAIDRLPASEVDTVRRFVKSENNPPARDQIDPKSIQALFNAGLATNHGTSYGGRAAYRATQTGLAFVELELDLKSTTG